MLAALALITTEDGRWRPGIGDPTLMGWVTVAAYFGAAYLAARAVGALRLRARALEARGSPAAPGEFSLFRFWTLVTAVLFALGINKQLDLQSWLTEVARDLSIRQGWYAERQAVQLGFVLVVAIGGAGLVLLGAYLLRSVLLRALGAVLGLGLLISFVAIRAVSFHHVDVALGMHPIRLNWVLELGGILVLAISAYRTRRFVIRRAMPRRPQVCPEATEDNA